MSDTQTGSGAIPSEGDAPANPEATDALALARTPAEEAALIERIQAGDEAAFLDLVHRCHADLAHLATCFVTDWAAAEGLARDAWDAVLAGVSFFDGRVALEPWVLRLFVKQIGASGLAIDISGAAARDCGEHVAEEGRADGADATPPQGRISAANETEAVARAMALLPSGVRAVAILRDVVGLSAEETCYVLGIDRSLLQILLHDARRRLHHSLAPYLPNDGETSGERVARLAPEESATPPAWIANIDPSRAEGLLADLYHSIGSTRGDVPNVLLAHSLNPKALQAHLELYRAVIFEPSTLSRLMRERIAVVVSAANICPYCLAHHSAALLDLGEVPEIVETLARAEIPSAISPAERAVLDWALLATADPAGCEEAHIATLRAHGFDDRAILDAALSAAYFGFVNRLVLMLGVALDHDHAASCRNVAEQPD